MQKCYFLVISTSDVSLKSLNVDLAKNARVPSHFEAVSLNSFARQPLGINISFIISRTSCSGDF